MTDRIIVIERLLNATVEKVWQAITDKEEMKQWYFDLAAFQPEVGFKFQFTGGHEDGIQYTHLCEVTEVIPNEKLTYSWRYEGYAGISFVTFELFKKESKTLLRLTHRGIDSFPDNPDFAIHNFEAGWNEIIGNSLKKYIDKDSFHYEMTVAASTASVFKSITEEIPGWWTRMFEGSANKQGDSFTVRFGPDVFKTMRIEEIIPNEKVVWQVTDSLINVPELNNKTEWIDTTIVWQLQPRDTNTTIQLTHLGLQPDIECYGICSAGWRQFCESLKAHVENGKGNPF